MEKGLVTLITPTGARPEAFSLCKYYMKRQVYKGPIQWIVIDDSRSLLEGKSTEKLSDNITIETYPANKPWRPGINTQRPNMDQALQYIRGEYIFTIEDDDWYHPEYVETMMYFLKKYKAVGQANSRYYAIKDRMWREWRNFDHCSLCETAIHADILPRFEEAINSGELFIDCALWRILKDYGVERLSFNHLGLACGIKQLPGRQGIGHGHTPAGQGFDSDPGFSMLKKWVGETDAKTYMEMAVK